MWCESWVPEMSLLSRKKETEKKRLRLDKEQFNMLCRVIENNRVIVKGKAGTGKTILTRELAKSEASRGARVLLLCFTDALGFELSRELDNKRITTAPLGKFALKLLRDKGLKIKESNDPEFWGPIIVKAAKKGLTGKEDLWDTLIIDEGQDMGKNEWKLIRKCVDKNKRIWVFMDQIQAFWKQREIPGFIVKKSMTYVLDKPYRCPSGIQALADAYLSEEADLKKARAAVKVGTIKITRTSPNEIKAGVAKEIDELLKDGFEPSEIAVISLRGMMLPENIMHSKKLGKHKIVKATDPNASEQIVCDTFLRFKGLERPAVIITDLHYVSERYEIRMNIALTRALSILRIIGPEAEIKKDSILTKIQ
jgi:superfamily I DNA and RNA helicase